LFYQDPAICLEFFEIAEQRTKADVVVKKLIKDMQHRSLSSGEGEGG